MCPSHPIACNEEERSNIDLLFHAVCLLQSIDIEEKYWLIVQEVEPGTFERIGIARSVENGLPRPAEVWKEFILK